MEILRAEHIYKSFGENRVLSDVSLHLNEGEIVSLLGVSGCGKTTLFNILSGLYSPDGEKGFVKLKGEDITGKAGKISYMLQKDLLFPYKRIIDNVSLPLVLSGMSKKQARKEAERYFTDFSLEGTEYKYPGELSGGMRQRAALLRTYLSSQGVALLDEPFSALDSITKGKMHDWYLGVMKKINLSTVFITHDIDEAIKLSDRVYILSGKPATIKNEFVISEKKPRKEDFNLSDEFLAYKRKIVESLHLQE